jgi:hypothetical protein
MDPYIIHHNTVSDKLDEVEKSMFTFFDKQHDRIMILFPYNFK